MDIRKSESSLTTIDVQAKPVRTESTNEGKSFSTGTVLTANAHEILPEFIQFKLKALTTKYGIPFDLSDIGVNGDMPEQVRALRKIVEMVEGNSKLLPEMLKLIKRLLKAEIKLAQFHRGCVSASLKHQEKIDKFTADIFLKMAGYQSNSAKLEHRTNVRSQLKQNRSDAYADYYRTTVYGEESKLIDAEFEVLESNKKILTASKTERTTFNTQRKQRINEYVESAFVD
jgi:hypothetical protein